MKKICFLIPGVNIGGIESHLLRFLNFIEGADEVTVIVRNKEMGDLWDEYRNTGETMRLQEVGYLNPIKWIKLFAYFKKQRFHTVCDFNGNFAGITMFLAWLSGIRNRIAFYRRSSNAFKETWLRVHYNTLVNWFVFKCATKILSNSQHGIEFFFPYRQKEDKRFKVLPNGINSAAFKIKETKEKAREEFNLPAEKFLVGHVGRFDPSKNHETIFKVARKLKKEGLDIHFLFAGKNTDGPDFKNQLKRYNIDDVCIGLGLLSNLALFYKTMDVFYFPSITEGQPNALIEAMVSGLPVITSDIPSIREVFEGLGDTSLLAPSDVKTASGLFKQFFEEPALLKTRTFKDQATEKFDMVRNFNLFHQELIK